MSCPDCTCGLEDEVREGGHVPIRCPLQPEQPEDCEESEKERVRNLGIPLGHVYDV